MNKDQVKGRIKEVKGKAKEVAGELLGETDLEVEGILEKNLGKVQAGFGDIVDDAQKAIDKK